MGQICFYHPINHSMVIHSSDGCQMDDSSDSFSLVVGELPSVELSMPRFGEFTCSIGKQMKRMKGIYTRFWILRLNEQLFVIWPQPNNLCSLFLVRLFQEYFKISPWACKGGPLKFGCCVSGISILTNCLHAKENTFLRGV